MDVDCRLILNAKMNLALSRIQVAAIRYTHLRSGGVKLLIDNERSGFSGRVDMHAGSILDFKSNIDRVEHKLKNDALIHNQRIEICHLQA